MQHVIATLWAGDDLPDYSANRYGPQDVINLWRGVCQHVTGGMLHVLCDARMMRVMLDGDVANLLRPGEDTRTCRLYHMGGYGIGGWTNVLEAFSESFIGKIITDFRLGPQERLLLVGLDTVFVRNCDWLFKWDKAPVGLPCDPFTPEKNPPCDAVVTFSVENGRQIIWQEYERTWGMKPFPHLYNGQPSEMALLRHLQARHGWPLLEGFNRDKLVSYKGCHVAQDGVPDTATIVYFHGEPKPRDLPADDPVREFMQ